jgi:hypothetical protein
VDTIGCASLDEVVGIAAAVGDVCGGQAPGGFGVLNSVSAAVSCSR